MLEVLEPLAPKFGDTPSIRIGCNRLQSVATDREVWCGNGINKEVCVNIELFLLVFVHEKSPCRAFAARE